MSSTLGRYRLLERLGAGGMADVWRAVAEGPEGFSRTVVIKRILGSLQQDESFIHMFLNEARLSAMLQHPNIVQVFDLGQADGEYYLAMEHVDGIELRELLHRALQRGRVMSIPDACHVTAEVAAALGYAHHARDQLGRPLEIVHRDVTPSNVMVTRHGEVKLLDFGIAKAAEHMSDERTRTGTLKGKFGYMSPEQAEARPVDARSDIFSLGIVFWECLTMRRLFRTTDDVQTLQQVREANVSAPSRLRPEIPPVLDQLVLRMLARDPADRYASCDRLLDELVPLTQALGGRAHGLRSFVEEMLAPEHDTMAVMMPEVPRGTSTTGPQATLVEEQDEAAAAPVMIDAEPGADEESDEEATLVSMTPVPPPPDDDDDEVTAGPSASPAAITAPVPRTEEPTAPVPRTEEPTAPLLESQSPSELAKTTPLRAIHGPLPPQSPTPLSSPAIVTGAELAAPSLRPSVPWKLIGALGAGAAAIAVAVVLARPRPTATTDDPTPTPAPAASATTGAAPNAAPVGNAADPPRTLTPPGVPQIHLVVDGTPGGEVALDGHSLGLVPLRTTLPRDPDMHTLTVRKRGFELFVRHVRSDADQHIHAALRRH